MRDFGWHYFFIFFLSMFLNACATISKNDVEIQKKHIEFNAVLTDPTIKKDFATLKHIAMNAKVYQNSGQAYFDEQTIRKLDDVSAMMIDRLQNQYHLNAHTYKIHTFLIKNNVKSCFRYYDSMKNGVGKSCDVPSNSLGSCQVCENYISTLRARTMRVVRTPTRYNVTTMTLIDTLHLRNGDMAYVGLELTPKLISQSTA